MLSAYLYTSCFVILLLARLRHALEKVKVNAESIEKIFRDSKDTET